MTKLTARLSSKTSRILATPSHRNAWTCRTTDLNRSCRSAPLGFRTVTNCRTMPVVLCTATEVLGGSCMPGSFTSKRPGISALDSKPREFLSAAIIWATSSAC